MKWGRIADANMNRLSESLKFIEDFIRFSMENRSLLVRIRALRSSFRKVKQSSRTAVFIKYRRSRDDLGRGVRFDRSKRRDMAQVIASNLERAKEAARILEEVFKVCAPAESKVVKSLRFQLYDIEQEIASSATRHFDPRLCAIIDVHYVRRSEVPHIARQLARYGATMIQLRAKDLSDRRFYGYARVIARTLRGTPVAFIVNDRVDIALACGAQGVHLGGEDLAIKSARKILGDFRIIGASARTVDRAVRAERDGADYLGVGAMFRTTTKPNARKCGWGVLRLICRRVHIPVIGIGGITGDNYRRVLSSGAAGVAVSSYLFRGSVRQRLRSLTGDN